MVVMDEEDFEESYVSPSPPNDELELMNIAGMMSDSHTQIFSSEVVHILNVFVEGLGVLQRDPRSKVLHTETTHQRWDLALSIHTFLLKCV